MHFTLTIFKEILVAEGEKLTVSILTMLAAPTAEINAPKVTHRFNSFKAFMPISQLVKPDPQKGALKGLYK